MRHRGGFRLFEIMMLLRMTQHGKQAPIPSIRAHWTVKPWVLLWYCLTHLRQLRAAARQQVTTQAPRRQKQTNPPPKGMWL